MAAVGTKRAVEEEASSPRPEKKPKPEEKEAAEPQLDPLQKEAIEAFKAGKSVFLTGCGGVGKSFVLHKFKEELKKSFSPHQWVVVAPMSVAAVAIGGNTLHSVAGFGVPKKMADFKEANSYYSQKRWRRLKVLIVDEISTASASLLDGLNEAVQLARASDRPMGGLQVVFCGDFSQLGPIVDTLDKNSWKGEKISPAVNSKRFVDHGYAFQARVWNELNLHTVELTKVFRQEDEAFVRILQDIRLGIVSKEAEKLFTGACAVPLMDRGQDFGGIEPTVIHCTNADVDAHNAMKLTSLLGELYSFKAKDSVVTTKGKGAEQRLAGHSFFKQCLAPAVLELKVGAQVLLVKNLEMGQGVQSLHNGSRGVVTGFRKDDLDRNSLEYPVVKFLNGVERLITPKELPHDVFETGTCIRLQVPLKLAWSITVHKCQGMTLDFARVILDKVFAAGQAYVGLSRVKTKEGLEVQGFAEDCIKVDERVLKFYTNKCSTKGISLWYE